MLVFSANNTERPIRYTMKRVCLDEIAGFRDALVLIWGANASLLRLGNRQVCGA